MFRPIQPEWHSITKYTNIKKISPLLQESISCVYQFKSTSNTPVNLPGIIDGSLDVIINLEGDLTDCYLIPSPKIRQEFIFKPNTLYFGFRILPLQAIFKFDISIFEIYQYSQLPLFDVASYLYPLYEQLQTNLSIDEQIKCLERYILTNLCSLHKPSTVVSSCTKFMITSHGGLKVQDLENYTGYSSRYLRTLFHEELGFSPKQFLDILYFQNTLKELINGQFILEEHMEKHGIYDESHFYKKFKRTFTMTPKEYLDKIYEGSKGFQRQMKMNVISV